MLVFRVFCTTFIDSTSKSRTQSFTIAVVLDCIEFWKQRSVDSLFKSVVS